MLGLCHFIFWTFSHFHEKVFTVTINVTVTRVPRTFWNLAKNWKLIFWGQKCQNFDILYKTYMVLIIYSGINVYLKKSTFFSMFWYFLWFFENLNIYKKYTSNTRFGLFLLLPTYGNYRKSPEMPKSRTKWPVETGTSIIQLGFFTIAVAMHPNGPNCLRNK